MIDGTAWLYHGEVVHRRFRPVRHDLRYRVYNLFADVDRLSELGRGLRLFSYNGFNLFSIDDRNHGPGDGTAISEHVWRVARAAQTRRPIARIFMFCYPRVLGYVFNPLTVYYGYDGEGALGLMIYEVNNTFGQRHSYAIAVDPAQPQACDKALYVSPFNRVEGTYHFSAQPPGDHLRLGINLSTAEGPCLAASFHGERRDLSDRTLLRSFLSLPWLPLQVMGGIRWEALKLWLKGLKPVKRPAPPATSISFSKGPRPLP